MLVPRLSNLISQRTRATYHQQKRSWVPKFVRRFMLQYPAWPFYATLGVCLSGFVAPYVNFIYKSCILSREEYFIYRENYNKIQRERAKHGTNLWFPFYNKNVANESPIVVPSEAEELDTQ